MPRVRQGLGWVTLLLCRQGPGRAASFLWRLGTFRFYLDCKAWHNTKAECVFFFGQVRPPAVALSTGIMCRFSRPVSSWTIPKLGSWCQWKSINPRTSSSCFISHHTTSVCERYIKHKTHLTLLKLNHHELYSGSQNHTVGGDAKCHQEHQHRPFGKQKVKSQLVPKN